MFVGETPTKGENLGVKDLSLGRDDKAQQQKTRLQTGFNYFIYLLPKYQSFLHTSHFSQ